MKILFAGTPANAARTLSALANSGHEIVGVLTRPDAEVGRKRELTQSPVALVAQNLGLPIIKASKVSSAVLSEIAETKAQVGIVVAYGSLLNHEALDSLELGWFNLHYSLLPDWRGAAPVQHSIWAGDTETGVTLFKLDSGMDTGEILNSVKVQIEPRENSADLLHKLTEVGITLLNQEMPRIESGLISLTKQVGAKARVAHKIDRAHAQINWGNTAHEVELQVRALNPEPVAFTLLNGETFRILDAVALGATDWSSLSQVEHKPGSIIIESKRVLVACGRGTLLELKSVQAAGKREMLAQDWARGTSATNFELKAEH